MKVLRTAVMIALTACLAFEPVASRAAGDDGRSRVTGGGRVFVSSQLERTGNTVSFSVSSLPRGDNVIGRVTYVEQGPFGDGTGVWEARPDCLVVDGDTAWIGGEIDHVQGGSTAGGKFSLRVIDHGVRDEAMGDIIEVAFGANVAGDCTDTGLDRASLELARGVVDVQASTD